MLVQLDYYTSDPIFWVHSLSSFEFVHSCLFHVTWFWASKQAAFILAFLARIKFTRFFIKFCVIKLRGSSCDFGDQGVPFLTLFFGELNSPNQNCIHFIFLASSLVGDFNFQFLFSDIFYTFQGIYTGNNFLIERVRFLKWLWFGVNYSKNLDF